MSRLIVKNLPKNITDIAVKRMFEEYGTVTDCKLMFANGVFRRFAFVGFLSSSEADAALKKLDNSFIGTSQLKVELCKSLGDNTKPRAWSKYSRESSSYQKSQCGSDGHVTSALSRKTEHQKPSKEDNLCSDPVDPAFQEFLELKGKSHLLDNKSTKESTSKPTGLHSDDVRNALKGVDLSSCVIVNGLPQKIKVNSIRQFLLPVKPKSVKIIVDKADTSSSDSGTATAIISFGRSGDAKKVAKRNGEFLGGFKLSISMHETAVNDDASAKGGSRTRRKSEDEEQKRNLEKTEKEKVDLISDTGRLFARNLSSLCTEDDIRKLLETFGPLAEVNLPIDLFTKRIKEFALVTFVFPEDAVKAYTALDGTVFQGRMLHLIPGKERPDAQQQNSTTKEDSTDKDASYKKKKQQEQKKSALFAHNWNSLFLGPSAVVDVLADKYETSKSMILNAEDKSSLGVRLALGETQIVQEAREFLLKNGVALDSFSQPNKPRSNSVILVKNLPAKTSENQIRELFQKYGSLGRVLLPPHGLTAIVEFTETSEAKAAFRSLAFRRFGSVPLFLEWAPGAVFEDLTEKGTAAPDVTDNSEEASGSLPVNASEHKQTFEDHQEDLPVETGACVFVKNLNFSTSDELLRKKFEKMGPVQSATVARKNAPKGELLSIGYGFVQYYRSDDAQTALKQLQGCELEGHNLELKISNRDPKTVDPASQTAVGRKKQKDITEKTTKILVRNIPFQASLNEIRELFTTFGQLKTVRLPKKASGGAHRGFGFVDFVTQTDADKAFKALCHSTHLYGRRLVLEWADTEESVEEIRKRTAEHFFTTESRARKSKQAKKLQESLDRQTGAQETV